MIKLTIDVDMYSKEDLDEDTEQDISCPCGGECHKCSPKFLSKYNKDKYCKGWDQSEKNATTEDPIWKPICDENGEYMEEFYTVNESGYINYKELVIFKEDINPIYEIGNVFKTKEAAQRMAERRKRIGIFENKMMEFADGYEFKVPYQENKYVNFFIEWEHNFNRWNSDNECEYENPLTIYMSEEQAEKAVDWANKHYPEGL